MPYPSLGQHRVKPIGARKQRTPARRGKMSPATPLLGATFAVEDRISRGVPQQRSAFASRVQRPRRRRRAAPADTSSAERPLLNRGVVTHAKMFIFAARIESRFRLAGRAEKQTELLVIKSARPAAEKLHMVGCLSPTTVKRSEHNHPPSPPRPGEPSASGTGCHRKGFKVGRDAGISGFYRSGRLVRRRHRTSRGQRRPAAGGGSKSPVPSLPGVAARLKARADSLSTGLKRRGWEAHHADYCIHLLLCKE